MINDKPTKNDPFGGYGFAIRTFWFNVTDIRLHRAWSRESLITDKPAFSNFVTGKAVSEDRVGVIGQDGSINEFNFTLTEDTDAKTSWESIKRTDELLLKLSQSKYQPEHIRIKQLISERFDENPPTATLFSWEDDWEIGVKAGWSIECKVPPDIFSKIEDEMKANSVTSFFMGVKWEAGLIRDEYAPPSIPTVWGLYCLEENRSPEPLRGYVSSIKWSPSNQLETNHDETKDDLPTTTLEPAATVSSVILNMPKSAIAALWILTLAAVFHLFK